MGVCEGVGGVGGFVGGGVGVKRVRVGSSAYGGGFCGDECVSG